MDGIARSTIVALFFAHPDQVVFADLAADLAASLLQAAPGGLDIHTEYDDVVIFDLPDRRICLAHSDLASDFPQAARRYLSAAAVVVAVGDKPGAPGGRHHGELCRALAKRIEISAPAQGCVEAASDLAFNEDAFDAALEDILSAYWIDDAPVSAQPLAQGGHALPEPPAMAFADAAPGLLAEQLAARFDREIAARDAAAVIAAARIAAAPAGAPTEPLVHRSAIHALNAAMLAFALPVGAALLTLGVLGRESLAMSSRAMAITGAGIGLAQNETVSHALAWMV